jgi:hypothetical protein
MALVEARDMEAEGWGSVARREGEWVKSWRRSEAKPARTDWAVEGRALGRARTKEWVEGRQVVVGREEVGATFGGVLVGCGWVLSWDLGGWGGRHVMEGRRRYFKVEFQASNAFEGVE